MSDLPELDQQGATFLRACLKRQVPPQVVFNPKKYPDDVFVNQRRKLIRFLRYDMGWSVKQIAQFCPLARRSIYDMIGR